LTADRSAPPRGSSFPQGGVFRASVDAVVVMDVEGIVRDWNPAAERLFGYSHAEAYGRLLEELIIPGPLRPAHRNALARYRETREATVLDRRLELPAIRADGSEIRIELTITRVEGWEPTLFAGFLRLLSERGAARDDSARLQLRMAFLAQAGLVLDRSLEYSETLRALAELTVPELADMTIIDLVEPEEEGSRAVAAAVDTEFAHDLEEMRRENPLDMSGPHPVAVVLRSGEPMLLPAMDPQFLRKIAQGEKHFELMKRLQYHSAIVVPLVARQRVLGALSLLRLATDRSFDNDDLLLAQELARRAGIAVDNARLFESTRSLARTLQDSLLPRVLPEIPGVRLAARYRAAQAGQEVGGDFYDAFRIGENRWGLAIGDVCGKGAEAAALTALGRYTIRALAEQDAPTVLRRLNDAVLRDQDVMHSRYLTVLFAIVTPEPDQLRIELAAAGHPAPLILRREGTVEQVGVRGALLGVEAEIEYTAERVVLRPGDTMMLYTDGLTDAQAPEQILSEADLGGFLEEARGMETDELAAHIEARATGGKEARDDIAILVLELPAPSASRRESMRAAAQASR
jgi:PAS domain S-box-containing protein